LATLRDNRLLAENEYLEGSLDLAGFYNLKTFSCADNRLWEINIKSSKNLINLDCSGNTSLKELACTDSQLTNLKLDDCGVLTKIMLYRNQLIDTKFLINLPSPYKRLKELYIANNNLVPEDLSFLTKFTNLKKLDLANNRFYGSLEFLKNADELEVLDIKGTNIDRG